MFKFFCESVYFQISSITKIDFTLRISTISTFIVYSNQNFRFRLRQMQFIRTIFGQAVSKYNDAFTSASLLIWKTNTPLRSQIYIITYFEDVFGTGSCNFGISTLWTFGASCHLLPSHRYYENVWSIYKS